MSATFCRIWRRGMMCELPFCSVRRRSARYENALTLQFYVPIVRRAPADASGTSRANCRPSFVNPEPLFYSLPEILLSAAHQYHKFF